MSSDLLNNTQLVSGRAKPGSSAFTTIYFIFTTWPSFIRMDKKYMLTFGKTEMKATV